MSVAAELVNNYAEIRRKFRNLQPPVKVTQPQPSMPIAPIVNVWAFHLEKWIEEDRAFGPVVHPQRKESISFDDVLRETCRHFGMTKAEIMADRRHVAIVYPRQVAMFVACKLCVKRSLPYIGRRFNKDHTTIISARDKIKRLLAEGHGETIEAVQAIAAAVGGQI